MQLFSREFGHSYETYSFGYCNFAVREPEENVADIYAEGYLPYSGDLETRGTFYMARSARIPLADFEPSSENRRIGKRNDGNYMVTETSLSEFNTNDEKFLSFCLEYFSKRHGPHIMPRERLEFILSLNLITDVITYTKDGNVLAYVLEVNDPTTTHFWFSFYDLEYINQSLGLWLMLDRARTAKDKNKKYFYLGTAYGEKGLYKTNFEPIEFWNGREWIRDVRLLKSLCRSDNGRVMNPTHAVVAH